MSVWNEAPGSGNREMAWKVCHWDLCSRLLLTVLYGLRDYDRWSQSDLRSVPNTDTEL